MRIGDYEVIDEIGRGGAARVYRVRDAKRVVRALKLVQAADEEVVRARFAREKSLLATLGEAEGFVPILDAGDGESGPFFIMPFLEGGTLRARLQRGRLGTEETLQLGRTLATAIGWAHERGIVHRDLKPENILFTKDGRPLIADLGIAKRYDEVTSPSQLITGKGELVGTPLYMAPEQMSDPANVDPRADVYALGALLYECLAGRPPFGGQTLQELIARVTAAPYVSVRFARPDAPLDLWHAVDQALSRDPAERYANGFDFATSLGARLPQHARLASTVQERPPRRRPPAPLLALVPLVPLLVVGILIALHRSPAPEPAKRDVAPVPSQAPRVVPVALGWSGEKMPPGMRKGAEKPVYVFDTGKGIEIELVYVPPGDFYMGAINGDQTEKPLHTHSVPYGYYVARTEVTWANYLSFCRATGHATPVRPEWAVSDQHPVVNVTWFDARAFCEWTSMALPTEPEWEKAARGSSDPRQWPWGDEWSNDAANILDSSSPVLGDARAKEALSDGWPYTAPVGSMPAGASPYGALDMAGNVWEWTADWYDPSIYTAYSNGRMAPPDTGTLRAIRGGSWRHSRFNATVSSRYPQGPDAANDCTGVRAVLRFKK